ncbi:Mrp family chromosome partitioning ATPase [Paenarthrobacter nicotinovorans]|uniref:AAA family ATPase n=1 Tax=Micrococcaceae TaxID=1268 RepID=UPI0008774D30|nr:MULTISPECIES: P-loop NTPase [Micrococcaceae]MDR6435814.1 Mrp family chromosome partitioning ATPase [Paenarthrobacter nicotinovorans]SCZ50802.1 MinD-like ATPase involved in chromosome partitioning or flagellar assembly [Arthrobacter sp. UNCCL28]
MSIPVVTVGPAQEAVVGGLEGLHGPVTVVRRCSELAELMAACQSGLAMAAVVAEGCDELTTTLVDRLGAVGVSVVALTDDPVEAGRLHSIGVVVAASGIAPSVLAARISEAVGGGHARALLGSGQDSGFADVGGGPLSVPTPEVEQDPQEGSGQVLAVWGPIGSPGRTLLAVNIAAELAAEGKSVVLVDADSYGASVSAVLGLLDEAAGLAQACRLADQGILDAEALKAAAVPVFTKEFSFRVLTGTTRADRWTELRAAAMSRVLERAKEVSDVVVVDTGFCLESDEELSFDTMAPRRNAATLRSLEMADVVFAVGAADAIGVPRLVRGLAEMQAAVPDASVRVVLNKVKKSAVGYAPRQQLAEAWERFGPGLGIDAYLPADPIACDAALLSGSVLLECAPESALRLAIANLVCAPVQQKANSFGRNTRAARPHKR